MVTIGSSTLVSVAMPVFNAGKHLRLAVQSILKQTHTNWELILIDDGSTDNAIEAISDIQDTRIRIFRDGKNKGLAVRLNECVDMARGEYFARMDQDDVAYPQRFARQLALLASDPELDLVGVRAITINEGNQIIGRLPGPITHADICRRPWQGIYLPHPTWMGRTVWFRVNQYASPAPYLCEDQELLLRVYTHSRFAMVDEILFAYRLRDRINLNKLFKTRWAVFKVQWRHFTSRSRLDWAFLSLMAFIGRLLRDALRVVFSNKKTTVATFIAPDVDSWQEALRIIFDN